MKKRYGVVILVVFVVSVVLTRWDDSTPHITIENRREAEIIDYNAPSWAARQEKQQILQRHFDTLLRSDYADK